MGLSGIIRNTICQYSGRVAVYNENSRVTFTELDRRVNKLSNALIDIGMRPGDVLAVQLKNCPEYREIYLACFKAGLVVLPINFRLTAKEIEYIVNLSKPRIIITEPEYISTVASLTLDSSCIEKIICIGATQAPVINFEQFIHNSSSEEPDIRAVEDQLALLMFTSGTTGRPKGARITRKNISSNLDISAQMFDIYPDSVYLSIMPMHASAGFMTDLSFFVAGSAIVTLRDFAIGARNIGQIINKYKVTDTFMVPTALNFLINDPTFDISLFSSLRTVLYTGSHMPAELLKKVMRLFGNIFAQAYGSTETIVISILTKDDHLISNADGILTKIESAGKPLQETRVRIVDDNDVGMPAGEIGEIVVKSARVMNGYLGMPELNTRVLKGGWYHTGDVGYIDMDGYIFVRDRIDDMIISGGINIYPIEIEEVILRHPAVLEVAVIGIPDAEWGKAVKAVVVPKEGADVEANDIVQICKDNLASYKKPRYVEFVQSLPKTASGKIIKKQLVDFFSNK